MLKYTQTTTVCKRIALSVLAISLLWLNGCATNPVTGRSDLILVPASWDQQVGAQQYQPSLQSQGGEYDIDPVLTEYVSEVGQRVAQHAENQLPYEFTVLNSSVPNAWALPGGKIAINRGLLTELNSEAELAAVLGHEVTHSAARHGAQAQSRGLLLSGVVAGTSIALQGKEYGQIAAVGAGLGAQLVTTRYGREAERESDYHGMRYMAAAGYDPQGAVDLQETFVRLSEGRQQDWINGLFASHPPSQERVQNNRRTAAELPQGGTLGRDRYQQRIAYIKRVEPAYEAYDKGLAAAQQGDWNQADQFARQAIGIEPKEANFYALRGDAAAGRDNLREAENFYNQAVSRNPDWFYLPLRRGIIRQRMNNLGGARNDLQSSLNLLPTGVGFYQLGLLERRAGNRQEAIQYLQTAAQAGGEVGQLASTELQQMGVNPNQAR